MEEEERDVARALAVEAVKLAPDLVPAAELAGRLLAEAGERRKAGKIIEAAWKLNPHPDLAEAYANLRLSDSARDRLARMQVLARMAPGHTESALAVARAALDAREFATARTALEHLAKEPTQRVAMLMAELEGLEGDEGRAREWMARALHAARDPVWTADGFVSERWLPVSPVTGRLDAFQWKVPVAELSERPLLEAEPEEQAPALPREVPSPPLNVAPEPAPRRNACGGPRCARPDAPGADHPAGAGAGRPRPRAGGRGTRDSGSVATDSSAFPVKLGSGTDRPAGVPVLRDCCRPSRPCGFARRSLSVPSERRGSSAGRAPHS